MFLRTALVSLALLAGAPAVRLAPMRVTAMTPAPGTLLASAPSQIDITLDAPADPVSVGDFAVILQRAGADGLIGTSDDILFAPASVSLMGGTVIRIDLTAVTMPEDRYRVTVRGSDLSISGLLSHWKLDEGSGSTVADSAGTFTGTFGGTSPVWTPARLGSGLFFAGGSSRVTTSAPDVPKPWTAAMWVNRLDSSAVEARLLDASSTTSGTSLKLEQLSGTDLVGFTRYTVTDYTFPYSAPVATWAHLTFVGTTTETSLYVDGVLASSSLNTIDLSRFHLGSQGTNAMLGILDDVRVFNRALTSTEIRAVAGLGGSVRDTATVRLDGEFSTTFPSGDGAEGGDFTADFRIVTTVPAAPTSCFASRESSSRIEVQWHDNATNESGAEVERSDDGVAFAPAGTAAEDATVFDDFGATAATTFYRVRAVNPVGASAYSNVSAVTTPLRAKTACGASDVPARGVVVSWLIGLVALAIMCRRR